VHFPTELTSTSVAVAACEREINASAPLQNICKELLKLRKSILVLATAVAVGATVPIQALRSRAAVDAIPAMGVLEAAGI
jgi:hypothetical protein